MSLTFVQTTKTWQYTVSNWFQVLTLYKHSLPICVYSASIFTINKSLFMLMHKNCRYQSFDWHLKRFLDTLFSFTEVHHSNKMQLMHKRQRDARRCSFCSRDASPASFYRKDYIIFFTLNLIKKNCNFTLYLILCIAHYDQ